MMHTERKGFYATIVIHRERPWEPLI